MSVLNRKQKLLNNFSFSDEEDEPQQQQLNTKSESLKKSLGLEQVIQETKQNKFKLDSHKFTAYRIQKNYINENQEQQFRYQRSSKNNNYINLIKTPINKAEVMFESSKFQTSNKGVQSNKNKQCPKKNEIKYVGEKMINVNGQDNCEQDQLRNIFSRVQQISSIQQIKSNNQPSFSLRGRKISENLLNLQFDNQSESQNRIETQESKPKFLKQKKSKNNEIAKQASFELIKSDKLLNKTYNLKYHKEFLTKQLQFNEKMHICFQRNNQGMNYFAPQFNALFKDDYEHCISAKKKIGPKFQMNLSIDRHNVVEKNMESYCGKIVGNFSNNLFNLYWGSEQNGKYNKIICTSVFREQQKSAISVPKCYEAYILKQGANYEELEGVSLNSKEESQSLEQLYKYSKNKEKIYYFRNKKPQFREDLNAYFLNFKGRISNASVKNFIFQDAKSGRQVMMFGRGTGNSFNLQFGYPLSPIVAFSLAIPHFSSKFLA